MIFKKNTLEVVATIFKRWCFLLDDVPKPRYIQKMVVGVGLPGYICIYLAYSNILHKSTTNLYFSHLPESWGWRNQTKHVIITRRKFSWSKSSSWIIHIYQYATYGGKPYKTNPSWWFQPDWKISVKMRIFPKFGRDENKKYLKPPPRTPFCCSWVIAPLQSTRSSHLPRHFHQGWLLQLPSPVPKPPSRHGFVTCPFFKEDHYLDNSICPATLLSRGCSRVSPLTKMLVSDIISVSSSV